MQQTQLHLVLTAVTHFFEHDSQGRRVCIGHGQRKQGSSKGCVSYLTRAGRLMQSP